MMINDIQRTKIVATIGPVSAKPMKLKMMYKAGMSIARLNGSHNSLDWHINTIELIRKTLPELPILLDIPGKKIRTSVLKYEPSFNNLDEITLTTENGFDGRKKISITSSDLHKYIKKGDVIYADDGTLKFTVKNVIDRDIIVIANSKGKLKSSKGINVPHITLEGKLITERDKKMIKFAKEVNVDYVGISFVESALHIKKIRKLINSENPKIIAKVENKKGIENLEEIVKETDVIMIDRGDLSTETNIESLAINQKQIINKSLKFAKPVIVATEMLDNMILNSYPTKAEVLDISNSILDGATATMLSGETAVGKYPIESIQVMSKISKSSIMHRDHIFFGEDNKTKSDVFGSANAIKDLCLSLPITKIIAITVTGFAARIISSQMLPQPILAISNNKNSARSLNLLSGTKGIYYDTKFYKDSLEHIPKCLFYLWKTKNILSNDMILLTALGYPGSGRRMNIIQTHYVNDLTKTFSWK